MGVVGSAVGRTAIATYLWLAGVIILIAAAVLVISWQVLDNMGHARYPGPLIIVTGVIFLVWALVQFGPLFYGPLGYSIPVGVPFLWYSGYQFMQAAKKAEE
jgi:MFS superfamily sulfate permease-like transporter